MPSQLNVAFYSIQTWRVPLFFWNFFATLEKSGNFFNSSYNENEIKPTVHLLNDKLCFPLSNFLHFYQSYIRAQKTVFFQDIHLFYLNGLTKDNIAEEGVDYVQSFLWKQTEYEIICIISEFEFGGNGIRIYVCNYMEAVKVSLPIDKRYNRFRCFQQGKQNEQKVQTNFFLVQKRLFNPLPEKPLPLRSSALVQQTKETYWLIGAWDYREKRNWTIPQSRIADAIFDLHSRYLKIYGIINQ
jgi:hypothetical protein